MPSPLPHTHTNCSLTLARRVLSHILCCGGGYFGTMKYGGAVKHEKRGKGCVSVNVSDRPTDRTELEKRPWPYSTSTLQSKEDEGQPKSIIPSHPRPCPCHVSSVNQRAQETSAPSIQPTFKLFSIVQEREKKKKREQSQIYTFAPRVSSRLIKSHTYALRLSVNFKPNTRHASLQPSSWTFLFLSYLCSPLSAFINYLKIYSASVTPLLSSTWHLGIPILRIYEWSETCVKRTYSFVSARWNWQVEKKERKRRKKRKKMKKIMKK